MAPFEMDVVKTHALAAQSAEHYGHFKPTRQRYPAYSAGIVPFQWMMTGNMPGYAEHFGIDVDPAREPDLGYESAWVHEAGNQALLLDTFGAHLKEQASLCIFYAKHMPGIEGTSRVVVGVGRILSIGTLSEFDRTDKSKMRGMIWERVVQHSIRPDAKDGFLLPYHQVIARSAQDSSIDVSKYLAQAPPEHWSEFSYGSELVTHDAAIAALLAVDATLGRIEADLGIATSSQRQWLHDELVRLWQVRGPFPGLGAVLRAFGLSRGLFIGHALQSRAGENADPWPHVDEAFRDPAKVLPPELRRDMKELSATWVGLPPQRRKVMKLLSRFELTVEQAQHLYDESLREKRGWKLTDTEMINNPYRIYEVSRHDPEGMGLQTVDRGIFPADVVRLLHPVPDPSGCDSSMDPRRIRAFSLQVLEEAAAQGHTLHFAASLAEAIRTKDVQPPCPVTTDIILASLPTMEPEVVVSGSQESVEVQLARYRDIRELVKKNILGRVSGQRHVITKDWAALLAAVLGKGSVDAEEAKARQEKVRALTELAESRFTVLAGPAGAGKTTVLGVLCGIPELQTEGLLLLAPTGKARVRMQELAGGANANAQTLAQFLFANGRYDGRTGRYRTSARPKVTGFGTVIVDEASMLTEDMLGALLDALQGVKRLILVGDPAQLPPIGAGRPFVDIIAALRPADFEAQFPRAARGYAELTIERRQIGADRPDLRLARWFSTTAARPGEDDIFAAGDSDHQAIRFVRWDQPDQFHPTLVRVLTEELRLKDEADYRGFNTALGATRGGDYDYFYATNGGQKGAVEAVDAWQILSPLRGGTVGVEQANRHIHEKFRSTLVEFASRQRNRSIPKPMGAERIVYGDKVINLGNHRRDGWKVHPQAGAIGYLANGEIGIAVGWWKRNGYPKILNVEFSSQKGYTYDFSGSDFGEEGNPALELAYALTVHKAQGSQFGLVIIVLPEGHPILSRELIYTALTRHKDRVVVLHQGPRSLLKDFAAPHRSETARRRTNLLVPCEMVEIPQPKGSTFLQKGLIHRTSSGIAVRSKSELLLAEALLAAGVAFEYEKPLTLGGVTRYPDFTIEDEISGRTVYWEHLGMMDQGDYRRGWDKKLAWYKANGVQPYEADPQGGPVLVTTEERGGSGLDMERLKKLVADIAGG